jgi:DNA-binding beta-propeller fold protein YncE
MLARVRAMAAAAGTAAMVVAAACLGALGLGADSGTVPGAAPTARPPPAATAVTVPRRVPACSTAIESAPALTRVRATLEAVPGSPFGVAVTRDGRWSFVALSSPGSVGVFRVAGPGPPALVRQVPVSGRPLGEALTPGGRDLLVADGGSGAVVISVNRAENGQFGAVIGTLSRSGPGDGAIAVAVSPDGRFAFIALENSASIAVYNLRQALGTGFGAADFVGLIPVGGGPAGMAVSPDGRWLYVTSEISDSGPPAGPPGLRIYGTLTVISMARAETDPAASVAGTVVAGCSPVRVITSSSGSVVWVTARGSDQLLAFSAARLRSDPAHSLIASVEVGAAPVDLALVDHGQRIVVADSSRFGAPGAVSNLAVVDVAAALAGGPALRGYVRAGGFPRQIALEPAAGVLLVTNFSSLQLEAVSLTDLP